MGKQKKITVQDIIVRYQTVNEEDYISLTDLAKGDRFSIYSWMKNRSTLELLIGWEQLYNTNFNRASLDTVRRDIGLNNYRLSPKKWIELTNAIGITAKSGRHQSGTWAHVDIALDFASWLNPLFRLYMIKEFRRLKAEEAERLSSNWTVERFLAARNYSLQTEAVKRTLLPNSTYEAEDQWIEYASEADLLNRAVFGMTAKQFREAHPEEAKKGKNLRDQATEIELLILSNLQAINAELIREALSKEERFERLTQAALFQIGTYYQDKALIAKGLKKNKQ